jgi:hypothetical protein
MKRCLDRTSNDLRSVSHSRAPSSGYSLTRSKCIYLEQAQRGGPDATPVGPRVLPNSGVAGRRPDGGRVALRITFRQEQTRRRLRLERLVDGYAVAVLKVRSMARGRGKCRCYTRAQHICGEFTAPRDLLGPLHWRHTSRVVSDQCDDGPTRLESRQSITASPSLRVNEAPLHNCPFISRHRVCERFAIARIRELPRPARSAQEGEHSCKPKQRILWRYPSRPVEPNSSTDGEPPVNHTESRQALAGAQSPFRGWPRLAVVVALFHPAAVCVEGFFG